MNIAGRAVKVGHDINTDEIIPARYLNTFDAAVLGAHCLEDLDPAVAAALAPGDILVAGKNFGCGSSREHAPMAIKAKGIAAVVADSFARIFYRNAVNIGLPILESPAGAAAIADGHRVAIDLASGEIRDETTGEVFRAAPFPPFLREMIDRGGLVPTIRERLRRQQQP
jgi:3-isopropylmalate/(R)-2-methylmalate dehydratase small subunit